MWLSTIGLLVTFGIALLWPPLVATAQPAGNVRRLGSLGFGAAPSAAAIQQSRFWHAMHELGWIEGQNITVERRYAEGHIKRLPALATELVHLGVDIIVTDSTPAALAAKQVTETIPIVMMGASNPVRTGLVASLAQPGGNITGVSQIQPELAGKQLEFLRTLLPTLSRVAFLGYSSGGTSPGLTLFIKDTQDAAE